MIILALIAAVTATPATLPAKLKTAKAGDVIILAAGDYGDVTMPAGDYSPALEIDASKARFRSVIIRAAKGIKLRGGNVAGPRDQFHGVLINNAQRISVSGMVISGVKTGISTLNSSEVDLAGNRFDGVRSDGINVTTAHHVRILGNQCLNFDPVPATFDPAGKMLKDGDHADCIQVWSTAGTYAVHDVEITGNTGSGNMQGIFLGRASPLGFDRITIKDNDLTVAAWHGITVYDGRDVKITGNRVRTVPGARALGFPFKPMEAWVKEVDGKGVTACGNVVEARRSRYGSDRCR